MVAQTLEKKKLHMVASLFLIQCLGSVQAVTVVKSAASAPYVALAKRLYTPLNMALIEKKGFRCSSKPVNWDIKFANFFFSQGKKDRFYYNSGAYWGYFIIKNKEIRQVWETNIGELKGQKKSAALFLNEYRNDTVLRKEGLEKVEVSHWCGKAPNNSGPYVRVDFNMGDWLTN